MHLKSTFIITNQLVVDLSITFVTDGSRNILHCNAAQFNYIRVYWHSL